jgi:filamentous hemagglutinin family protein
MDSAKSQDISDATIIRGAKMDNNELKISGMYNIQCHDSKGNLLWEDEAPNLVTNVGRNLLLDTGLRAVATTVSGYIGLISSVSWTAAAATDTMVTHGGWNEASAVATYYPVITRREIATFSATAVAGAVTSSAATFAITGTTGQAGTIMGCFLITGTNAAVTLANTNGILYSAGTFTGGSKSVGNGDSISVTYTTTLS